MGEALRRQMGTEGAAFVPGNVVAEHGPDPDPVTSVVPEHLVDEADGVGPVHRLEHDGYEGALEPTHHHRDPGCIVYQ